MGPLQQMGTNLGGQTPSDFAHRSQQGQAAAFKLDRLVGDARGSSLQQGFSHARVSRQMQVGEQHHVVAEKPQLLLLWLLHLHHQMGGPGLLPRHHLSPSCGKRVIGDASAGPSAAFDPHLQSLTGQFPDGVRGECHPLFVGLDFLRDADAGHRGRQNGRCHGPETLIRGSLQSGAAAPSPPERSRCRNRKSPTAAERLRTHLQQRW